MSTGIASAANRVRGGLVRMRMRITAAERAMSLWRLNRSPVRPESESQMRVTSDQDHEHAHLGMVSAATLRGRKRRRTRETIATAGGSSSANT